MSVIRVTVTAVTLEEARSHIGRSVLYSAAGAEAEEAVIAYVTSSYVFVRCRRDDRFTSARPGDLTMPAEPGAGVPQSPAHGDLPDRSLAASQARLNEIVAEILIETSADPDLIERVLDALRDFNLAGAHPFHGESSRRRHGKQQELQERLAAISVWRLESYLDWQAARARAQAYSHKFMARQKEITLKHRGGAEAALIYLITHAGHGAAKVGIGDMAGSRLAQHRREGWQLLVAFQVTAKAAVAIEYKVLRRWRHDLGLPSYLKREQMPQGGWTETVAAGRVDLAATVAQICELAQLPEAKPAAPHR
jgi:hypothetical protein